MRGRTHPKKSVIALEIDVEPPLSRRCPTSISLGQVKRIDR